MDFQEFFGLSKDQAMYLEPSQNFTFSFRTVFNAVARRSVLFLLNFAEWITMTCCSNVELKGIARYTVHCEMVS